jgi:hypothetical protein
MVIKRVDPMSIAKVSGTLYALLGLFFGALFSVASLAGGLFGGSESSGAMGALLGAGAVVLFPILYGAMGFVMTLIMAVIYNFVAGMVGGVEIEVQ